MLERRVIAAVAVLLLCLGLPAAAQTPPAAAPAPPADEKPPLTRTHETLDVEGAPLFVPEVNTVATKLPLSTLKTPASVSVVTAPLIERQDDRVLGDALANVSGVNPQTESGVADYFILRGFDSESSGLVLTDGAPEPEVTFYQLYNVDRVEVLRGPASFLYGGNPLAGAVDLVSKQPLPYDSVGASVSAGSFGTNEGKADVNWSSPNDTVGLRVNALWETTDGYRDGRGGKVHGANPTLVWRPDGEDTVTVSAERLDSHFKPDAGLPILLDGQVAPVPLTRSYQSPFDTSDQAIDRATVDWQRRSGDLTLENKLYYRGLDWRSDGTLLTGAFPDQTGTVQVSRALTLLDDRQKFWGDRFEAISELATGSVHHRLQTGLEIAGRDDVFTLDVGALPSISLLAPVETAQQPVFLIPGQSSAGDSRTRIVAPYALDHLTLSPRFELLLGARFDHSDYRDRVSDTSRSDSQLSPFVGAVYSLGKNVSLYANAGRGFAPPSTRVVGPQRAETGSQAEVGAKGEFLGGRLRAQLALYDLDRRNIAIPDANGITAQVGSQRSRGVELEVTAEPLPGLFALLIYAYDDAVLTRFDESVLVGFFPPTFATVDRTGNAPPLAPAHLGTLWLSHPLPRGFEIGLGAHYASRQFIAADNAFAIPSALTAEAALSYTARRFKLHVNAKNLTDVRTYTRGFGSSSVIPASGFAIYSGIDFRWDAPASRSAGR